MKVSNFKVEVLNKMDSTREAWLTSKPTIKYSSESELNDHLDKMKTQDLPLSAFKHYDLKITSSLLFRDLLFCIRPCTAWASSFRITPLTDDYLSIESGNYNSHELNKMEHQLNKSKKSFSEGNPLDSIKDQLPLATMTSYVISIDSRTLRCLIATLVDLDPVAFLDQLSALAEVLGEGSFRSVIKNPSAKSLLPKLRMSSNEPVNRSYSKHSRLDEYTSSIECGVQANIGAQFIRQHFSKIRSSMFDEVKTLGYNKVKSYPCTHRFKYYVAADNESLYQLLSRRVCWAANWDWDSKDSWALILKDLVISFNATEFAKLLPCKCNYKACTVSQETRLRLWKNKGVDGVTPDDNPVCPILVGDPNRVQMRKDFYKSDSIIMSKWEELRDNNIIRNKVTIWSNENER